MCSYRLFSPSRSRTESADSSCYGSIKNWRRLNRGTLSERTEKIYSSRNTIIFGPTMATALLRRCASSDEDEAEEDERMTLSVEAEEEGDQSRTDASEDSVEVRVLPITTNSISQCCHLQKNKRKLAEPRKLPESFKPTKKVEHELTRHRLPRSRHCTRLPRIIDPAPPPKKHCPPSYLHNPREAHISSSSLCPFRPWSSDPLCQNSEMITPTAPTDVSFSRNEQSFARPELRGDDTDLVNQEEPLSLVLKTNRSFLRGRCGNDIPEGKNREGRWEGNINPFTKDIPVKKRPTTADDELRRGEEGGETEMEDEEEDPVERAVTHVASNEASGSSTSSQHSGGERGVVRNTMAAMTEKDVGDQKSHLRNYKNMTRERRMEANARERTRVHTISAAFDTLRRAVPAYAHNQRLSKLSVLRIACAYIVTLSRVAGKDYSASNDSPSLSDCVDKVTRTIQTEGKVRRRRDE